MWRIFGGERRCGLGKGACGGNVEEMRCGPGKRACGGNVEEMWRRCDLGKGHAE